MSNQRCKGSRDLLPADMAVFRRIESVFISLCTAYGYREIRTPTIEYLHQFTSVGTLTPSMLGRVYSFLDWDGWSGERVVLRPEATIPAARLYIDNMAEHGPTRLFYVENMFTFEPTGTQPRERWQCGAEMMGDNSPSADAELVVLAAEILQQLGIGDLAISLSHAGIIRALLQESNLPLSEQGRLFDRIMDGDYTSVIAELKSIRPDLKDSLSMLFDLKGDSSAFLSNLRNPLIRLLPKLQASFDNFIAVTRLLTDLKCSYLIDMTSGEGFEYYTGIMYRFHVAGERIGGGGRYDNLIPLMGGGEIAACGFALDVNRLMKIMPPTEDTISRVLVRTEGDKPVGARLAFEIARILRTSGYTAELDQGYDQTIRHRWALRIRTMDDPPSYILTDQCTGKTTTLDSPSEILGILQVANAGKAGPP